MRFVETSLHGLLVIQPEPLVDERGFFARTYCASEFERHGLPPGFSQCSISYNERAGTLRGMHYQAEPHAERKLVRCTSGEIYDVALDLRPASPTYLRWEAFVLSADNRKQLYIPEGVAHGFQTLTPRAIVFYQISVPYAPAAARGVRWDDPAFGIEWPDAERSISERDQSFSDFEP